MSFFVSAVRIDAPTEDEFEGRVCDALINNERIIIATPNPEMIVKARRDSYFRETLNNCYTICDGFGLYLAGHIMGAHPCRITGVRALAILATLAQEKSLKMFLVGAQSEADVHSAAAVLAAKYGVRVVGAAHGPAIREDSEGALLYDATKNSELLEKITSAGPDILVVGFGMGKQEKWLRQNLPLVPSVKWAIGVGGALDYLSGSARRAPRLLQIIGLEWLYRLLREPRRIKRILNAVFVFPVVALIDAWKKT